MYVNGNIQKRSCDSCRSGREVSVACSECVCSFRYPACKTQAPYYISICGLFGCIKFFPFVS
jgi:hypothetical protein